MTSSKRPARARLRGWLAAVLIVLGVALAPVAAVAGWVRVQLVDTDRFAAAVGPLAQEPEIQTFVADRVTDAVRQQIGIPALVDQLFAGIKGIGLPGRANAALDLLAGPVADGLDAELASAVQRVVSAPAFARTWTTVVTATHARSTALLSGSAGGAVTLADDGALTLRLGPVVTAVRTDLLARGLRIAERIPAGDLDVVVARVDQLALARDAYGLAVAVGYWLPLLALALVIAGLLVSVRRIRTLGITATVLTVVFVILLIGLRIGRAVARDALTPAVPAATTEVLYDRLTALLAASLVSLALLAGLTACGAWLFGASRPAVGLRTVAARGFTAVRRWRDGVNLDPGGFGAVIDRLRRPLRIALVIAAAVLVFLARPVTLTVVGWLLVGLIVLLVVIELLRKPVPVGQIPGGSDPG